ncbi:hypothetical protein [Streptomyces sp. NBC_01235]|uniref:hypothetical protein n=1 Tax=Streptomyces sp. NBC_01235 TaxID=2903788 RepID=UPI002E1331E8|nr:hypothetical protein OG289_31325 [Streptomyces sp. NBC_01235]
MADTRRKLRSGTVVLGGMGLLAAALTACSSDPDKRCVDRDSYNLTKGYKVVADKNCKSTSSGKTTKVSADGAWYYGGKKKGSWVDGGSFTKPGKGSSGSTSSSGGSSGVSRGGFGSDSDSGSHKGSSGG